jgi:RHS repeat-associated protein
MLSITSGFDRFIRTLVIITLVFSATGSSLGRANVAVAQAAVTTVPPRADAVGGALQLDAPAASTTLQSPLATPDEAVIDLPTPTLETDVSATFTSTLTYAPPLTATQVIVSRLGGHAASIDNRIQLDVPPGLFKNQTQVSITPKAISVASGDPHGMRLRFDLDALDQTTGQKLTQFDQPITLTVNVSGLIDLANMPEGQYVYVAYQLPDGEWSHLDHIRLNETAQTISVQLPHFSSYGSGIENGTPGVWNFIYDAPQVSTFSGSTAYQIPLKFPAGRSGLQPNLSLSYGSSRINARSGDENTTQGVEQGVDIGPIGDSWSLDGGMTIARERWQACKWNDPNNWDYGSCLQDVFTLIVNGTGYDLKPTDGSKVNGRYYVEGNPALDVERHNGCVQYNSGDGTCTITNTLGGDSPLNVTGEYWTVTLADGTQARLGYTANAEQVTAGVCNPNYQVYGHLCKHDVQGGSAATMGYKGRVADKGARSWRVDTMTNTLGATMIFTYTKHHDRVTLRNIYYNYDGSGDPQSGSNYLTHIVLTGSDSGTDPTIDEINIYNTNNAGAQPLIKKYVLTRTTDSLHKANCKYDDGSQLFSYFTTLSSIQEQDSSGISLPATTFNYDWRYTTYCYDLEYLTQVDNGYGGVATFNYEKVNNGNFNYRAIGQKTTDGVGNSSPLSVTYAYGTSCVDSDGSACESRMTSLCGACASIALVGHDVVTETHWNGTTKLNQTVHYFYNSNPAWQLGKEYRTVTLDGSGNLLAENNSTLSTLPTAGGTTFAYVGQSDATTYNGGLTLNKRMAYTYDIYGNQTAQYDYGAEERVVNAGFENGNNNGLNDWNLFGTPASLNTTTGFAGQNSVQLQGSTDGGVYQDVSGLISGTTYLIRAWVKATAGTTAKFELWAHDTNPNGTNGRSVAAVLSTTWTLLTLAYPADGTGAVRIHLHYMVAGGAAGTIYVDEVALAKTSDVGDERSTHNFYRNQPNGLWLVGLKYGSNVFAGITLNKADYSILKHQTFWYFDDYRYDMTKWNDTAQITKGLVTMVAQGIWPTITNQQPYLPYSFIQNGYDAWGNPIVVTDTLNHTTTTKYDATYHLYPIVITNTLNQAAQMGYDLALGVPLTVTDPNGASTNYRYDTFGRLIKVIKPLDSDSLPTVEYTYVDGYNLNGLQGLKVQEVVREISGNAGAVLPTLSFYDGLGRLVQTRAETVNGSQQAVTNIVYNAQGAVQDSYVPTQEAFTWEFSRSVGWDTRPKTTAQVDAVGRGVRGVAPDGTSTSSVYGLLTQTTEDANRHIKVARSDALGQLTAVDETLVKWGDTFEDGVLTGWNTVGTVSEANGVARITGDGTWTANINRSATLTNSQGVVFSFKYDLGAVSAIYVDTGAWAQSTYRRWGLYIDSGLIYRHLYSGTVSTLLPLMALRTGVWYRGVLKIDGTGEFVMQVWERDNPAVSAERREVQGSGFAGSSKWNFAAQMNTGAVEIDNYDEVTYQTTQYDYDVLGNLVVVTDALRNTTVISYNVLGQKTDMIDPDMGKWKYGYDLGGNLITQTDNMGQVLWFKYDKLNRLTEKRTISMTGTLLAAYTYDVGSYAKGRRVSMSDPSGSASWTYDIRGRVVNDAKFITNAGTFTTSFGYDAMDRVLTTTYPTNEVVTQTYNAMGALENLRSASNNQWYASNLDYNANGSIALLKLGNNLTTNYTYFPTNFRLQSLKVGTLLSLTYKYDNVGNVMSITDTASFATPQYQRFTYDSLDRLITATVTGAITGTYNEAYAFNQIGNITNTTRLPNYKYGLKPHAVLTASNNLYSYDGNGNMLTRIEVTGSQRITYTQGWDSENRLIAVTATNGITTSISQFVYDSDGNRVLQVLPDGSKTAYASAIEVSITGTQRITKTYYSAGSTLVAMRVYSSPAVSTLYFMYTDHLGSASLTTDITGTVIARQLYDAWGNVRYVSGAMPTSIGYAGQYADSTGLTYMGARFYSSVNARFISADTIVPSVENPQTLNRFSYANNNPLKYIDPTGHEGCAVNDMGACSEDELRDLVLKNLNFRDAGGLLIGFAKYWLKLLGQTQTGRDLLAGLEKAGIEITEKQIHFQDIEGDQALGTINDNKTVGIDIRLLGLNLSKVLAGTDQIDLQSFKNFNAEMAGIVGHELFHLAIGDKHIDRGYGDTTGMAYRVGAKIINELLYGGNPANYQPGTDLTNPKPIGFGIAEANRYDATSSKWASNYHDIAGTFRVKESLIVSLTNLPPYGEVWHH